MIAIREIKATLADYTLNQSEGRFVLTQWVTPELPVLIGSVIQAEGYYTLALARLFPSDIVSFPPTPEGLEMAIKHLIEVAEKKLGEGYDNLYRAVCDRGY